MISCIPTLLSEPPFQGEISKLSLWGGSRWAASWVAHPDESPAPAIWAFRLKLTIAEKTAIRLHVTADERFELYVDEALAGRGPDRGTPDFWFYSSYDVTLEPGEHVFIARVWAFGKAAPYAQMTVKPGFLLAAEGEFAGLLDTGIAPWEAKVLTGYSFIDHPYIGFDGFTGKKILMDGHDYDWDWMSGHGTDWKPVVKNSPAYIPYPTDLETARLLSPSLIPPMMSQRIISGNVRHVETLEGNIPSREIPIRAARHLTAEAGRWQAFFSSTPGPVRIPPRQKTRVIIDLEDYYCAYPFLTVSGGKGSMVRLSWAEALYINMVDNRAANKDNRNEIEGRFFSGYGNEFRIGGGEQRRYDTLWWQAGRYLELEIVTGDEELVLEELRLEETRYPLEMESTFSCDDSRWEKASLIMLRGLQTNAHEIYSDCPYYEQFAYIGDNVLDALATYAITRDDRLVKKTLLLFAASAVPGGFTQSRYPCRIPQIIPPFSLFWVLMLYNHALWRGDREWLLPLMPAARSVIDAFLRYRDHTGIVEGTPGWNFMDWAGKWDAGLPPDGRTGKSGAINWLFVLVLARMADLEDYFQETELAARAHRLAQQQAAACCAMFWSEKHGMFADDQQHTLFSEHTQSMALLSGQLVKHHFEKAAQGLLENTSLTRATIYFSHYIFEVYHMLGRPDRLWQRLDLWFELDALGFTTTPESPEPSRSDCHAWGAHPLYHATASILGIRPDGFGFKNIRIRPQPGPLQFASGKIPHPAGWIEARIERKEDHFTGTFSLPPDCHGRLILPDGEQLLKPGCQELKWKA